MILLTDRQKYGVYLGAIDHPINLSKCWRFNDV